MTGAAELARTVVTTAIAAHPRSLQKRIGPSEIGRPCDRWILHKLNGDGEPDRGPAWKPAIGTAMHAQLEEWFNAANFGGGDTTAVEWVTEWEVTVGRIGRTDITGHSDLFHVPTGTVIDFKVVGPKQLAKYRLHGPSEQYRVQAHLYAAGFIADGGWGPAREVAIWFLPRDGELDQAVWWSEPVDPHIAAAAMNRANRLHTMLQVVGIDQALAASPLCDDQWCTWCRTEKRIRARAAGVSLFADDMPAAEPTPAPVTPIRPAVQQFATCEACGWKNHERDTPRNRADYERSFETHEHHFCKVTASCACHADQRKPQATKCTTCGEPMSPIVMLGGFTTHPTCDPQGNQTPAASVRPVPATPQPVGVAPVTNLFN